MVKLSSLTLAQQSSSPSILTNVLFSNLRCEAPAPDSDSGYGREGEGVGVVEGCPEEVAQEVNVEGVVYLEQDIILSHHHQLLTNNYK